MAKMTPEEYMRASMGVASVAAEKGDYQKAFDNFSSCNQLRREAESYDPVETETQHVKIISIFV